MGFLKALLPLALALAGCFDPQEPDGMLRCGAGGSCPAEFECGVDQLCWRIGHAPSAADAALPDVRVLPACSNGIDDDCDGKIDHPEDVGCSSKEDNDEHGAKRCDDGVDNDADGLSDFHAAGCGLPPGDPQCDKPDDDNES